MPSALYSGFAASGGAVIADANNLYWLVDEYHGAPNTPPPFLFVGPHPVGAPGDHPAASDGSADPRERQSGTLAGNDSQVVYVGSNHTVKSIPKQTDPTRSWSVSLPGAVQVHGLAASSSGVFAVSGALTQSSIPAGSGQVFGMDVAGTQVTVIAPSQDNPQAVAVTAAGQPVWVNDGSSPQASYLNDGSLKMLVSGQVVDCLSGLPHPRAVAADGTGIYWIDDGGVKRVNVDCKTGAASLAISGYSVGGTHLVLSGTYLFVDSGGVILRAVLGSSVVEALSLLAGDSFAGFDVAPPYLYFLGQSQGSVSRVMP